MAPYTGMAISLMPDTSVYLDGTVPADGSDLSGSGGDENGQHDDIVAVKLSSVCSSSSFAVYGEDRDVTDTALRHIRTAYSSDGTAWTCYTQTNSGSEGGTPAFRGFGSGDSSCSEGPSHAPNGAVFNIPQPAQYVEFAFWVRPSPSDHPLRCAATIAVLGADDEN